MDTENMTGTKRDRISSCNYYNCKTYNQYSVVSSTFSLSLQSYATPNSLCHTHFSAEVFGKAEPPPALTLLHIVP